MQGAALIIMIMYDNRSLIIDGVMAYEPVLTGLVFPLVLVT